MNTQPELKTLLHWYEQMWTIRYFEENAVSSFRQGLFGGSTHPCICQEAICVGAASAMAASVSNPAIRNDALRTTESLALPPGFTTTSKL